MTLVGWSPPQREDQMESVLLLGQRRSPDEAVDPSGRGRLCAAGRSGANQRLAGAGAVGVRGEAPVPRRRGTRAEADRTPRTGEHWLTRAMQKSAVDVTAPSMSSSGWLSQAVVAAALGAGLVLESFRVRAMARISSAVPPPAISRPSSSAARA